MTLGEQMGSFPTLSLSLTILVKRLFGVKTVYARYIVSQAANEHDDKRINLMAKHTFRFFGLP